MSREEVDLIKKQLGVDDYVQLAIILKTTRQNINHWIKNKVPRHIKFFLEKDDEIQKIKNKTK